MEPATQRSRGSRDKGDTVLELRDTSVTFEMERGTSRVLDGIDLDIRRDEILGIVGESGSGKSMCASSMLDAVVDPGVLGGEVIYYPQDGDPVDIRSLDKNELKSIRWEEIAFLVQAAQSAFNPTMSIKDHFVETLTAHNSDVDEGLERARELMRDLYLNPRQVLNSYPHELSGGMKQRTLIALSLILDPEILVMDEPTSALDLLMQRSIISLLQKLKNRYDLTLVFVTHDLPIVAEIADRLAVMYAFEIVEVGPTKEIIEEAAHPYTRALINSVPNLVTPIAQMEPIAGSSPDPVNVPTGCSYHPRCPLADDHCESVNPNLSHVSDEHEVACFHSDQAAEAIPIGLDQAENIEEVSELEWTGRESDEEPLISLDNLHIHFDNTKLLGLLGAGTIRAVDGVSLDVMPNDIVVLVGESGCGKTTLGKAAIGLHRPTSGTISYRGQDIWESKDSSQKRLKRFRDTEDVDIPYRAIRRSLQIIHQDPGGALNSNYPVERILSSPLEHWEPDLEAADRQARIHGLLEYVGMTPAESYARRYPHQLSGGEQQRVALIRALLLNPDLILADEAVSALDVSLRIEAMDLLLRLQTEFNTSFIFISHNLSNARYLAEKGNGRIGVMYLGEIVEIGPPREIINNPMHPYTQVLRWASGELSVDKDVEDPPLRALDVPDAADPPSGCKFHTRCPKAREVCQHEAPSLIQPEEAHEVACFRAIDDHEYWDSEPLEEEFEQRNIL